MILEIREIYKTIKDNGSLFLRKAVETLAGDCKWEDAPLDREIAIVACVFLQMAVELLTKAAIIRKEGIWAILDNRNKSEDSETDLIMNFAKKKIKTAPFWRLKKFLKQNEEVFHLDKNDWYFMDLFQELRNKLIHLNYNFDENELVDLKTDMTYVVAHVVPRLIGDGDENGPAELLISLLGRELYRRLVKYKPYARRMEELIRSIDIGRPLTCWDCGNKTFSQENNICLCCNQEYGNAIGFVDCIICGEGRSVVYDLLNIEANTTLTARCLACDMIFDVRKCRQCGDIFIVDYSVVRDIQDAKCPRCELGRA